MNNDQEIYKAKTKYANDDRMIIYNKISKKEKITFEEFITIIEGNFELELYYEGKHYGITQFEGFEIYEWNKEEGYQSYKRIGDFVEKATVDGILLKDAFKDIKKINLL